MARIIVRRVGDKPTLGVAYFFSKKSRRSSVGHELRKLCQQQGYCLLVFEVDILNAGGEHDLLDNDRRARWEARIRDGEVDVEILTSPCSS